MKTTGITDVNWLDAKVCELSGKLDAALAALTHIAEYWNGSDLLTAAKAADNQISAIHAAFGAPGDWGYERREGAALFELYKFQIDLRAAIAKAEPQ